MQEGIWNSHVREANTNPKRKRDIEWTTGKGEIMRIADMEESHLLNTVAYINRRVEEYKKVKQMAITVGLMIPEQIINKKPCSFWVTAMLWELHRRETKKIRKAQKILAIQEV